jgi:hypothetical protein
MPEEYPIRLPKIKFCLNCEVVFSENVCPLCAGPDVTWRWLQSWLKPMPHETVALNSEQTRRLADHI